MAKATAILGPDGNPLAANGHASRAQVTRFYSQRAKLNYDAARDTDEYKRHWANADALDPDGANGKSVRHKLMQRSRYEGGSNGYYKGMLRTHTNMVWGTGPKLRMLTRNKPFNQLIEREFYAWWQQAQMRRKGWCLTYARYSDGESFGVLQTNPKFLSGVSLDVMPLEAEQCQTPAMVWLPTGYIDGIRFDEFNNVLWYDVLPVHPGNSQSFLAKEPIRVAPRNMLHWFKLERAGTHRGIPEMTPTLNLGASARRVREATVAKAETEADFTVLLKSLYEPSEDVRYEAQAMDAFEIEKRMAVTLPNSLEAQQLQNTTPGPNYSDFNRSLVSEQARPISMPYNAAACDSSTYSFASGKLDTLCYRGELDVERADCVDLLLNPLFAVWFAEWSLLNREQAVEIEDRGPDHQWDWPAHPVIDNESENRARDTALKNGTETLREAYSAQGRDYEDELAVMAEDWFGDASEPNIKKARQINLLRNVPSHIVQHVAAIMGIELPKQEPASNGAQSQQVE